MQKPLHFHDGGFFHYMKKGAAVTFATPSSINSFLLERILQTKLALPAGVDGVIIVIMVAENGLLEIECRNISRAGIAGRFAAGIFCKLQEVHRIVVQVADKGDVSPIVVEQVEHIEDIQADGQCVLSVGAAEVELMHQLQVKLMVPGRTHTVTLCIFTPSCLQIGIGIHKCIESVPGSGRDHRRRLSYSRNIRQRRVRVDDITRRTCIDHAERAA